MARYNLTRDEAKNVEAIAAELGVKVKADYCWDGIRAECYIRIADASTGNVTLVQIETPTREAIVAAVSASKTEAKKKASKTRSRIAAENECDRS